MGATETLHFVQGDSSQNARTVSDNKNPLADCDYPGYNKSDEAQMIDRSTVAVYPIHLAIGEPLLSSLLELTLTEAGYQTVIFRSARSLWESLPAHHARFIITEGRFADGFEALNLCRLVRREYPWPYVYIYVISRRHETEAIEDMLDAGANDYSVKPVNPVQIRTHVLVGMRWLAYIDAMTTPKSSPALA
jgi:CheY-like chemotaxis protein